MFRLIRQEIHAFLVGLSLALAFAFVATISAERDYEVASVTYECRGDTK